MQILIALLSGIVFGLGLLLAGMANPDKVLAFLDLAGAWDPSLMLVMAGGMAVSALGYVWARRHDHSCLGLPLQIPNRRDIDARLVLGSLIFGVGWGLAGICPGPALVLLGQGKAISFVLAMCAGMGLHALLNRKR